MSFTVWLQADPAQTHRLPSEAAVEEAFAGLILRRDPNLRSWVTVGTEAEHSDLHYSSGDGDALVHHMSIFRPQRSMWLWDALWRLMSEYDMFMYWPGERLIAAMARPDVPVPDDMQAERAVVRSADELRALVESS